MRQDVLLERIVSGGQSGVDRAALEVARELGLASGGWCPRGRSAEDGSIDANLPLVETPSSDPAQRTEWNVRDSDATLVLLRGEARGGTALTLELAERWGRPCCSIDLAGSPEVTPLRRFLAEHQVRTLNVAGPRESERPGIGAHARAFLRRALGGEATHPG